MATPYLHDSLATKQCDLSEPECVVWSTLSQARGGIDPGIQKLMTTLTNATMNPSSVPSKCVYPKRNIPQMNYA